MSNVDDPGPPEPASAEGSAHAMAVGRGVLDAARAAAAGHPHLEEALARVEALDALDVGDHAAELDLVHGLLRTTLSDGTAADPE